MNLIEQLGGYEKAKAFLNATSFTIDELIMMQRSGLRTHHVEKALLEYRRQYNIFEVGDKVVFNSYELDAGIREIQDYHNGCIGAVFRHATDEEIKAGLRLEQEQSHD